ncbi:ribosomal RNA small subunit methyltransferase RsmB [secondary endosymbiont of Heteropsylla cubana]|uniref:Ribosomal RNA small subunit methyltransferase B n=1 Tax=secondary endosymbiont of Heteropsylla cubana TaxID=134287 RepID=J3TZ21_9ENTR|nr:16S rRNA (cytosine(967)-C(5))-methyltransferase RsmB [secondary endosymbiont of Heteropsylla cubana]AFP85700.1 ribosomal RNA small subunit methyltransferase RsmB [secondary endosymbiont of Heteropsylla cubana]
MNKYCNLRVIAARVVAQVLEKKQSLSILLPSIQASLAQKDAALLQEISFGIMRFLPQLQWLLSRLMKRELRGKRREVHYLLMVGLYQLIYTRIPPYAVLSETVEGAATMKCQHLKQLINAVLRQFQRQKRDLLLEVKNNQDVCHLHPKWLKERFYMAWPMHYEQIMNANNQHPPMWLRVNQQYHNRDSYLSLLTDLGIAAVGHKTLPYAIRLETPYTARILPGFYEGWVSVQDASSQGAVVLLAPKNGEKILDLCAAPGCKTTHILEIAPAAQVVAVDIDIKRVIRIYENLTRLKMQANVVIGDGCKPNTWSSGIVFDRILLDPPCSATGVIRRHPDVKWLRRDSDIAKLAKLQKKILCSAWKLLKPGGVFLYTTCSILPEENCDQIAAFLDSNPNALLQKISKFSEVGLQLFPQPDSGDGFFYAKMIKEQC